MRNDHDKRTLTFSPIREVVVTCFNQSVKNPLVLDQRTSDAARQLDTSGKVLKIKKPAVYNNYTAPGPCFIGYLKTLLYAYVLCRMKDEADAQWLARISPVGVVL